MSEREVPGREVAHRLFAAEFDDATVSYSESDEERAPKYVVTPSGARVNRLFAVGVLTEVEDVNEELLRARVVDPTGAFVSYAGQYQPDEMAFFERAERPSFVALTGKARTFEPDDGDRIYTSVRPESTGTVDASTRDRWVVSAAEATLERVSAFDAALDVGLTGAELQSALREQGYGESLASGIPLAIEHYGTSRAYLDALRRLAIDALEVVAGDRESVRTLDLAPDEGEATSVGTVPDRLSAETPESGASSRSEGSASTAGSDPSTADSAESTVDASDSAESAATDPTPDESRPPDEPAAADAADTAAGTDTDAETADGLGDFDAGESTVEETSAEGTATADELYELSEEERREVEENHDVGFESATEVDDPGEAGIDVPDADELAETVEPDASESVADASETADSPGDDASDATGEGSLAAASTEDEPSAAGRAVTKDEPSAAGRAETEDEPSAAERAETEDADVADESAAAADVDLESAVVAAMDDLDGGDGADREAVVAAVVEEYGVGVDDAEDAIESALMSGKCYEPTEDSLKAI